ncbi:MAG: PucR family transcriptional regulator ligand-binding domain-containing protein [Firmicutes bacterium]|nr:PucR family transcriptional regulator ligand-binding domain-containing protein [Bacillota bacterium]
MKATVKDCLELDAFIDAKVVASPGHLLNEVKSVSVIDACSGNDMDLIGIEAKDLLLTGFLNIRSDVERQCLMIKKIAAAGGAGLAVFFVGKGIKSLDPRVIETAERSGLPLIMMAPKIGYSQTISEVMDRILYGDSFGNSLINNTVFHLLNFEKHSSFQSALREAAINNDFQIILLSEEFNPILTIETRHKATIADAIRLGKERNVEGDTNRVYTMIDVNGVLTYWGPVSIGSDNYYMFIVDNEDSYTAGEITKLAEIIELAMGMWKYTPERDAKSDFIKALIRGNKSLAYTLQDEAKISGSYIVSVFFCKGLNRDLASKAFTDFEKSTDMSILRSVEDDEIYGMILNTDEEHSVSQSLSECAEFFGKLNESEDVKVFHVTGINGIEGAGDAYKLINESWTFVQNIFPYKSTFTKYELTLVSNCINIQIQGGFVKKNYTELIEPFKSAGENKGKQLLDTLETFVLDAGMSSGKTAEIMNIHVNTVQYRLKKINEMLGVEVTGNRVIPGLTMALALKRLERAVS